jgi:PAS domain S-box-containing protein
LAAKKILQNGKNANEDTGKIVEVNEQAAALTGYREATLREMSVSELVLPGQSDDYSELFFQPDQVSTDTLPDGTPLRFKRADGSTVPIDMVSNYVEIDDQQYRLGIVRDITDRRERIRELERKRDFLQQIQEAVNLGGWEGILDSELNVWSEEAYRILGLPQDTEPTAEAAIECFHPEDRPTIESAFDELITNGTPYDFDSDWHLLRTVLPVGCALSASHSTTKILANSSLFAV